MFEHYDTIADMIMRFGASFNMIHNDALQVCLSGPEPRSKFGTARSMFRSSRTSIVYSREGHFGSRQIVGSGLTFASTETSAENYAEESNLPKICRLPTSEVGSRS